MACIGGRVVFNVVHTLPLAKGIFSMILGGNGFWADLLPVSRSATGTR